jgi:hypothetical protein
MALKPLNRKAEVLAARAPDNARPYAFGDCCPGFLPGWEVGSQGEVDPCTAGMNIGWMGDLQACHPCYWSAQVPDYDSYPGWRSSCANIATDLATVGPV